jgi:coenzyme F420-reducing hydrogenase beta subunit
MVELFETKKDCCGCAACMNICPNRAINMKPDADGFIYPKINESICTACALCKKACAFQNVSVTDDEPLATYVAINKDQTTLLNSASGGIFGALAMLVFKNDGVIFGCAFNSKMVPEHVCIDNPADIKKLQGSKYVQSSINNTMAEAKHFLKRGRVVLYTGTPCQIAGLKTYLGKDYNNLVTADLICHGVPSVVFFKGYIKYLEGKLNGKVINLNFRDKTNGWGYTGKVIYEKDGALFEKLIPTSGSYYSNYFLRGDILRESCYVCKYACGSRQGDFTMGDYWGVEKAHPDIRTNKGVSVLLVNSVKGMELIDKLSEHLTLTQSSFEQARAQNMQLRQPTAKTERREAILKTWREGGYQAVADEYERVNKKELMKYKIKMLVPLSAKNIIKKLLRKK